MIKVFRKILAQVNWTDTDSGLAPDLDSGPDREVLLRVVKAWQNFCFDLEHVSVQESYKKFEEWIHFISDPNSIGIKTEVDGYPRNWHGMTEALEAHREKEFLYVTKNISNLRSMVWSFVSHIGESLAKDSNSKRLIEGQLGVLQEAITGTDVNLIQTEVRGVVKAIQSSLIENETHHKEKLQLLQDKLKEVEDELSQAKKHMAQDALTQLYNRASLDEHLQKIHNMSRFMSIPSTLLMIDLDFFKKVNDQFGHPAGDDVLKQVADLLVRCFPRRVDFVSRYGGEEFCIVVAREGAESLREMTEAMLAAVRSHNFESKGVKIPITLSVGLAESHPEEDVKEWLERADHALYLAKDQGRDRCVVGVEAILKGA